MPKTKDAFALADIVSSLIAYDNALTCFRNKNKDLFELDKASEEYRKKKSKLKQSKVFSDLTDLNNAVDEKMNSLIDKGFNEPRINSGVDRIGSIEQSIRLLSHSLKRATFLIERVKNHCQRLMKYRTCCKPFSANFDRAARLADQYLLLLANLKSVREMVAEFLDFNCTTLKTAFNEEFGIRLRLCRRRKKISQDSVAKFLGVTKAAYSHYETGKREMPSLFVYQLAKFFGVSTDYLLGLQK